MLQIFIAYLVFNLLQDDIARTRPISGPDGATLLGGYAPSPAASSYNRGSRSALGA